jgi:hypothetical protein
VLASVREHHAGAGGYVVIDIFTGSITSVTPGAAQAALAACSINCHDAALPARSGR